MPENKDLIERLAAAEAEVAAVRAELAKAQEPKPWARWKPEDGESYYYVRSYGNMAESPWGGSSFDAGNRNFGNCFKTKEAAERHSLRIRSMVPTCPVPKVGQQVYRLSFGLATITWAVTRWEGALWQKQAYNLGHIFATKEAANAWIGEYADAWTTLEDAS